MAEVDDWHSGPPELDSIPGIDVDNLGVAPLPGCADHDLCRPDCEWVCATTRSCTSASSPPRSRSSTQTSRTAG